MSRRFAPLVCVLALGLAATQARGDTSADRPEAYYRVRLDSELREMEVRACFAGRPPRAIRPGIGRAARAFRSAQDGAGRALELRDGRIDTSRLIRGGCVTYRLDFEVARRAARFSGRFGSDVMTSAGGWLWRSVEGAPRHAHLRFELPEGLRVAVPWPRTATGYRLERSAFRAPSFVAFGRFTPLAVEAEGARVNLVRLGEGWQLSDEEAARWVRAAFEGIATVQGRFPVDDVLVVMTPIGGRGMGFGMVRRGGGHSVGFQVGQQATVDDLRRAWVGWHELSHLQLPALPQRDAWLYEGMATYFQEVIPARVGAKTPEESWRALLRGFRSGARSRGRSTLGDAAESMMQTGGFQRVYWAGTVFALDADVALRTRGSSLDAALRGAAQRWRGDHAVWNSARVCGLFDRSIDGQVIMDMRARYEMQRGFPPTDRLLRRLGVRRAGERDVELVDAELSGIRDAIMARN